MYGDSRWGIPPAPIAGAWSAWLSRAVPLDFSQHPSAAWRRSCASAPRPPGPAPCLRGLRPWILQRPQCAFASVHRRRQRRKRCRPKPSSPVTPLRRSLIDLVERVGELAFQIVVARPFPEGRANDAGADMLATQAPRFIFALDFISDQILG